MKTKDKILIYIHEQTQKKPYPPSLREIGEGVNLKSTSTIHSHLHRLKDKGLLDFEPSCPRTISLTDEGLAWVHELQKYQDDD